MVGDLRRRGYDNTLAMGPIIGSGTLANLIPPSLGAVLIGSLAGIPIADLLIAGVGPAIVVILLFCSYIAIKARRFTGVLAEVPATLRVRLGGVLLLLPMIVPVFFVTGVIYLGVATPTEASATGAFATFVVAAAYGRMNWRVFNESLMDALEIAAMIMLIVAGSKAYSQILAITGIAPGFAEFLAGVTSSPTVAVLIVLLIALVLGCFMDQTSVIFVTIPLVTKMTEVWADQITGYGMVYITFLAAPWVLARRRHIAVDLLQESLGPQTRPLLGAVLGLVGFLYNAGFTWLAWSELARILARDSQFSDAILVPQWTIYWVLPVGSGLMALEFALNGIEDLRAYLRGVPAPRVAAE